VLAFYWSEALRAMRQHRTLLMTATLTVAAAMAVAGVFLLLAHNAEVALARVGDRREMVIYLRDDVRAAEREAITARLEELYGSVTYVSKEEAWRQFSAQLGDPALLEAVGENPLPASLHVRLRPDLTAYEAMERAAQQVAQFPEVEDVRYGGEWVRRLEEFGGGVRRLAILVGLVVAACLLFIFYSTLRLSVASRSDQVQVLSRMGASTSFISMPFVLEAMVEAGVGALLALGLLFAARAALAAQFRGVAFLPPLWAGAFVACAVALGFLAAWVAVGRALRRIDP
jgi:cell division transport system permease protein